MHCTCRASEGLTPLHISATWGRQKVLQLLIANGADPFLEDDDGNDALDLALVSIVEASLLKTVKHIALHYKKCVIVLLLKCNKDNNLIYPTFQE